MVGYACAGVILWCGRSRQVTRSECSSQSRDSPPLTAPSTQQPHSPAVHANYSFLPSKTCVSIISIANSSFCRYAIIASQGGVEQWLWGFINRGVFIGHNQNLLGCNRMLSIEWSRSLHSCCVADGPTIEYAHVHVMGYVHYDG
ncbi:unnamed protein product [Rhizoctonia solani]|uniref:Uncharacterized protein n=1 Tax=Rhizoctonia solani TaxID=456999 RepID=A0A8H3CGD0_9AGAM